MRQKRENHSRTKINNIVNTFEQNQFLYTLSLEMFRCTEQAARKREDHSRLLEECRQQERESCPSHREPATTQKRRKETRVRRESPSGAGLGARRGLTPYCHKGSSDELPPARDPIPSSSSTYPLPDGLSVRLLTLATISNLYCDMKR